MGNFEDRYAKLNSAQKEAVDNIEGPVLVVAGPGSGKTELLALRIANILRLSDAPANSLLCLTFTDSAALNMRQRLVDLIGADGYKVAIHTFHSFGVEIINKFPEYFYNGARFKPADDLIKRSVLEDLLNKLHFDNILKKSHPYLGFTYLKDISTAISNLKQAGLSPQEFKTVLAENEQFLTSINDDINRLMSQTVSKKLLPEILDFVDNYPKSEGSVNRPKLQDVLLFNLREAVEESLALEKTTPLSIWKENNTKKEKGLRVLKEQLAMPKMQALADLYEGYQQEMYDRGYFDFDDMLLQVIAQLESNETLKAELQERYLYISVDEFQDTNDAQMRILYNLTDSEINEGRPNIMAVGDDDQAIYKFQGAEISNIYQFKNRYRDPKVITLTHNYRSGQSILDLAREIVLQGKNRLENIFPEEINKELLAAGKNARISEVKNLVFSTPFYENSWIVKRVEQLIEQGVAPEKIAILARNHKNVQAIIPFFNTLNIPVQYEKEGNVLDSPPIQQLIQMVRFMATVGRQGTPTNESLLPEILSYPFWINITALDIWEVSEQSYKERKSWIECINKGEKSALKNCIEVLLTLGKRSLSESFDDLLLDLINNTGYRHYYFGEDKRGNGNSDYLSFLADLNTFLNASSNYWEGKQTRVEQLLEFVDLHLKNEIGIAREVEFVQKAGSVNLMTTHKAKGLEFEVVFVINCTDSVWKGRGKSNTLKFPQNMPITPDSDDIDDQMRLFFVALTRAERLLYLTSYQKDENGKPVMKLSFISNLDSLISSISEETVKQFEQEVDVLAMATGKVLSKKSFSEKEEYWLKRLVENYQLNASHLNDFLNINEGGPIGFFEKRILRFPQPKNVYTSFGSVMHKILADMYMCLKKEGKIPAKSTIQERYVEMISAENLGDKLEEYLEKGKRAIDSYYLEKVQTMSPNDLINLAFYNQGVVLNGVMMTGEIDKLAKLENGDYVICDYKTGGSMEKWEKDEKSFMRQNQLMFYKLLLNNSRDYSKFNIVSAYLDFLEPNQVGEPSGILTMTYSEESLKELTQLIEIVYQKIKNLDFPDTSTYSKDYSGMRQFKEDLLNGLV